MFNLFSVDIQMLYAPYFYCWGFDNSSYYIKNFDDVLNKAKHNCITLAFAISGTDGKIWATLEQIKDRIKIFIQNGGSVILSFGGANGPYLWDNLEEEAMYQEMVRFLSYTGIAHIDYDIEGSALVISNSLSKLINVSKKLQDTLNTKIQLTLPCYPPGPWDDGGLTSVTKDLLHLFYAGGVKLCYVNLMLMDYYAHITNHVIFSRQIIETVCNQLCLIYSVADKPKIYSQMGITPMIGVQDDNTTFSTDDLEAVLSYAKSVGIGFISCWALQRDQVGSGSLAIYTNVNKTNLEFHNIFMKYHTEGIDERVYFEYEMYLR
jgi:chitinase